MSSPKATLAVVLGFCLVALAVYPRIWSQAPLTYPDSQSMIDVADDIRDGSLDTMSYRTIGVPLLMIAFGTGRGFFYFSVVSYLAAVMLLAWAMGVIGISRGLIYAGAFLLVLPPYIQVTGMLLSECASAVALVAGIVGLIAYLRRGGVWLLALPAVLIGLWPYLRPTFQFAGILVAALLFLYRDQGPRYRRAAVAVGVASVVLMGAYALHNRIKFGWTSLTTSAGYGLSTRTVPVYDRIADAELREIVVRNRNRIAAFGGNTTDTWHSVRRELLGKGMDDQEVARIVLRENVRLILKSPFAYFHQVCIGFANYVQPFMTSLLSAFGPLQYGWVLLNAVVLAAFFAMQITLWGGWVLGRIAGRGEFQIPLPFEWTLPTLVIFYTMFISSVAAAGEARYRAPTEPLIVFVTIYSFTMLQAFRRRLLEQRNQ